jgi:hypothetical protein
VKRILVPLLALLLIAAAPANRIEFVFDERIPADNQQLLQQALTSALQSETQGEINDGAQVIISLRVIEPEPQPGVLFAETTQPPPTPAERTR